MRAQRRRHGVVVMMGLREPGCVVVIAVGESAETALRRCCCRDKREGEDERGTDGRHWHVVVREGERGRGPRDGVGVSSAMVQCRRRQGEGEREKVRKKVRARVVLLSRWVTQRQLGAC